MSHNPPRARRSPDLIEWEEPEEEKRDSQGAVLVSTLCMLILGLGLLGVAGVIGYLMYDTSQHLGAGRRGRSVSGGSMRMGKLLILWLLLMVGAGAGGGWLTMFGVKTLFQLARGDWRKKRS